MYVTINPLGYSRNQNCILHLLPKVKFHKFKKELKAYNWKKVFTLMVKNLGMLNCKSNNRARYLQAKEENLI